MRIIAGEYKGRKLLPPPRRSATRPITGMVKKSLFGMLAGDMPGAAVADLYCGTGTLGLEALSRGAERCFFAERDRAVIARLRRNINALTAADRCAIWRGDVMAHLQEWLGGLSAPLDVAFVDPPYAETKSWAWQRAVEKIFNPLAGHLARDGVVVLRLPAKVEMPKELGRLALRRLRRYGEMQLALLGAAASRRDSAGPEG